MKCIYKLDDTTYEIYMNPYLFEVEEEWKQIVVNDIEYNYWVSNLGRVMNINTHHILNPSMNKDGYLVVQLRHNKKGKTYLIHRLVAIAFLPNPDNLPQINHINEVKSDNRLINLEWCTNEYNVNYGTRTERALETKRSKRKK